MKKFTFASSRGGKPHTATLHNDGHVTCTCPGYKSPNRCWHYKEVLEKAGGMTGDLFADDAFDVTVDNSKPQSTGFVPPMLASALPDGARITDYKPSHYVMERKFDGHRIVVEKGANGIVRAWSRAANGRDLPTQILAALECVPANVLLDTEMYVEGGTSTDVTADENWSHLKLAIFDILRISGHSVMEKPGYVRRKLLEEALSCLEAGAAAHIAEQREPCPVELQAMWDRGWEGVIVKLKTAIYIPKKRSKEWVKFKKGEVGRARIEKFEAGRLGPHSIIIGTCLKTGVEVRCKSLNDEWRAKFAIGHEKYIGRTLIFAYIEITRDGRYKSAMADHILEPGE